MDVWRQRYDHKCFLLEEILVLRRNLKVLVPVFILVPTSFSDRPNSLGNEVSQSFYPSPYLNI